MKGMNESSAAKEIYRSNMESNIERAAHDIHFQIKSRTFLKRLENRMACMKRLINTSEGRISNVQNARRGYQ